VIALLATSGVVVVALGVAVLALLAERRRVALRLRLAADRLDRGVVATGSGLAEATSVVERAVDRAVVAGGAATEAERRLSRALETLPDGVIVFDGRGEVVFRNEVAAGYMAGRSGEALVEEAIAALASEIALGRDVTKGGYRTVDLFGPPRRTVVLQAVALETDHRRVGVLVVIDDVTSQRRLEAVRRDFVANISHELKTPIGALGLLAETLLAEDDPEVANRLAERMLTEAFRVGRTIDDLLALSQIEVDEDLVRDDVPVHRFVAEAVERVRPAAEQQGISIEVEEAPARLQVVGDRRQLVSATYNLLENAVKYSDPGSTVQVRARTDGRWVDVAVEDRGIGIPRRDLERVFERFYRVDQARSRETGGTGLGLSIVRHVARNHGGSITVSSREGEGSTFMLVLPTGLEAPARAEVK
jgi:two-component system sensor histidine kinase SenX3